MDLVGLPLFFLVGIFVVGYLLIIFEYTIKINKTAIALVVAIVSWILFIFTTRETLSSVLTHLDLHLSKASQIILFFLGSMTLVEVIDSHQGFKFLTDLVYTSSKRKILWAVAFFAFFLSALIDNLTTTILMISLLRKLIPRQEERLVPCCLLVVAANAGGAWTPIGDITTTMLWIDAKLTSWAVMKALFLPSLVSMLVPLLFFSFTEKGRISRPSVEKAQEEPGARVVFAIGLLGFLFVPFFHAYTELPPFMGVLFALGILWLVTDLMHYKYKERLRLRVPYILTKVDTASILFFLGVLLTMDALDVAGALKRFAVYLSAVFPGEGALALVLGFVSSVIDNVPLVAATMGMYAHYPLDAPLWHMIAYAAGTGGSFLLIGSSAGIALMGMEKISFFDYVKKATFPTLLGFLAGLGVYLLLSS